MSKNEWLRTRRQLMKDNPPNHEGYYVCTYCGKWVLANEITWDHVKPSGSHPWLKHAPSNLVPCCYTCNSLKGSQSAERFLRKL